MDGGVDAIKERMWVDYCNTYKSYKGDKCLRCTESDSTFCPCEKAKFMANITTSDACAWETEQYRIHNMKSSWEISYMDRGVEQAKERMWDHICRKTVGVCAICNTCGGSSSSFCSCAKAKFMASTTAADVRTWAAEQAVKKRPRQYSPWEPVPSSTPDSMSTLRLKFEEYTTRLQHASAAFNPWKQTGVHLHSAWLHWKKIQQEENQSTFGALLVPYEKLVEEAEKAYLQK